MAEHLDRDRDPEFVDTITELRGQELRALRDGDLAREATRRHQQLQYANPWNHEPDRLTRALERREQLLAEHQRRDAQAADIRTAHAAERHNALTEAEREIAAGQHDRDRDETHRAQQHAWARAPIDEQQRRADLPPDQQQRENQARNEIHAQDHPLPSHEEIAQQRAEQQLHQQREATHRQHERWNTPIHDHHPTRDPGYSM
ncbi:hypothetical protein AB0C34_30955 [Nocardia sp. NPDC049220]|uniref:hypothetical protein n=1 Tax=Nocardia sp. NPDC049220 TaxID=3155273 RepID=UPI0033DB7651